MDENREGKEKGDEKEEKAWKEENCHGAVVWLTGAPTWLFRSDAPTRTLHYYNYR
jgi:hypothetical protein